MTHEELKAALESELETVVTELGSIAVQNEETGDWVATPEAATLGNADPNDVADVVEDWNERRAVMAQLEVRYRNIVRALDKFATSTYGICEICGEPIEHERLAANPAARTNIAHIDQEKELPL